MLADGQSIEIHINTGVAAVVVLLGMSTLLLVALGFLHSHVSFSEGIQLFLVLEVKLACLLLGKLLLGVSDLETLALFLKSAALFCAMSWAMEHAYWLAHVVQ